MLAWLGLNALVCAEDVNGHVIPDRLLGLMALVALCPRRFFMLADAPSWVGLTWVKVVSWAVVLVAGCLLCRLLPAGSLGAGDVKLLSVWCLYAGPACVWAFACALAAGGVVAFVRKREVFALGPWICLACVIMVGARLG